MPMDGVVPHPADVARRWREKGYWRDKSLADEFWQIFDRFSDRTALVDDDGRTRTYSELGERASRLAANLYGLGLRPRDAVVLQLPNSIEFVEAYFALQKLGAIPIAALVAHRYREVSQFVSTTQAKAVLSPVEHRGFDFIDMTERIADTHDSCQFGVVLGEVPAGKEGRFVSIRDLLEEEPDPVWVAAVDEIVIDPDDPAVMQLSGGTTGIPKLIPRTHNDYSYNSRTAASVCEIKPDHTLLLVLPMAHNLPLACPGLQGFLMTGARVVVSPSARPADVFRLIDEEKVTHIHSVPALIISWINADESADYDLSSVEVIQSGGQRLQPEVRTKTESLLENCTVQENFGMAEGLLMFVRLDDPEEVRLETCGRPISPHDEVKLVDKDGNEVRDGEVGEMICRGPYTLRGYFRADDHNRIAFIGDGFYRSGDLMRKHPSGNYVVAGRTKDLINRGGEKISAEEVENLILSHPNVVNVACVPVPDERLGERMCACVVLRPAADLTLEKLCEFLMSYDIAKFKLPERLEIFDALPLSNVGKVSKKELVTLVSNGLPAD